MLLAWPTADTDWRQDLGAAQESWLEIIAAAATFEPVVLAVQPGCPRAQLQRRLPAATPHPIIPLTVDYDDTWVRDSGPLTRGDGRGERTWLDFRFDAWGGKFEYRRDDRLVEALARAPCFSHLAVERFGWVLEGGAVETDGAGTLLTTGSCLQRRMPGLSREQIARRLNLALGTDRVLWLDNGALLGDDTDGHVDTLARLGPGDTLLLQGCEDPEDWHHGPLAALAAECAGLRTRDGRAYQRRLLPLPAPRHDPGGRRLPAGYANFLVLNGAVLMPTYGDEADDRAARVLEGAFPGRQVLGVDCRSLIRQGGSLHCATMHLPAGCLRL